MIALRAPVAAGRWLAIRLGLSAAPAAARAAGRMAPVPERSPSGGKMIAKNVGSIVKQKQLQQLVAVPGSATVAEAVAKMCSKGVGAIVVRSGTSDVEGIFTERDVMTRVVNEGRDPKTTPMSSVMSPNVRRVAGTASLEDALSLMVLHGYRHLLVEEGGRVAGLISIRDLMTSMVVPDSAIAAEGRVGVVRARAGETLQLVEGLKPKGDAGA
jgi:signal-transduction protein with cAMP-binding, CBS, and nucleotidyltransferase domain